jgi:iron complex outermembrane receptor protein
MYLRALNRSGELAADNRTLSFRAFGIDSQSDALTVDNQAELNFNTGTVAHQALVGVDLRAEDNSYHVGRGATTYTLDVFAPAYGQTIADPGARGFQIPIPICSNTARISRIRSNGIRGS